MDITNYNNINLIRNIYDLDEVSNLPNKYFVGNSIAFKLYLDIYLIKEYACKNFFIEMNFFDNGILYFKWYNSTDDFQNFKNEILYCEDEIIALEEFLEFSSLRGHNFLDKYNLR